LAAADVGDPPSRVARLNYLSGPVSFRPGSVEEWTAAMLNHPLTAGDHLWTDTGSQAELHIGSTAIRMNSQTAMSILNLDDRMVQISVTQGTVDVHIRNLAQEDSYEIDTPNVAVSLLRAGDYRVNADSDQSLTDVVVRGGEAEATGGGRAFTVHPRQMARISGAETISEELSGAPPPDGFDRWCDTRERREERTESARYVPREMIGYEDLDEYGVWRNVPGYGWVWAPTSVVSGWAPYRYGHWAWVEPWGWTWIDDAPWGFAPFHYGRWAFVGGGWIWAPGVIVARPVYAPALVAFVGGPRFSVLVGTGGVGVAAWFPLGPHEVYRPAYHVSNTYVQQVNITHVTNVTNITNVNVTNVRYLNQNLNGAVTAVPQQTFSSAQPVAQAAVPVPPNAVAQAQVTGTTAQIAPQRASVLARPGGSVAVATPPARLAERQVVARYTPPPPPVSFAAKQQALQQSQGRPLDAATLNNLRTNNPPRNPMVRTAGSSGMPGANTPGGNIPARPALQQPAPQRPKVYQPPSNPQGQNPQMQNAQPRVYRNDRPPSAQLPSVQQSNPVQPQNPALQNTVPRNERPTRQAEPRNERPAREVAEPHNDRTNQPRKAERNPHKEEKKQL
jgi:hypothetical protein